MRVLALLAVVALVAACQQRDILPPLEAGYTVTPEHYVGPVSCYRTIGYSDCHQQPLNERRLKYGTYVEDLEGAKDRQNETQWRLIPGVY